MISSSVFFIRPSHLAMPAVLLKFLDAHVRWDQQTSLGQAGWPAREGVQVTARGRGGAAGQRALRSRGKATARGHVCTARSDSLLLPPSPPPCLAPQRARPGVRGAAASSGHTAACIPGRVSAAARPPAAWRRQLAARPALADGGSLLNAWPTLQEDVHPAAGTARGPTRKHAQLGRDGNS